MMLLANTTSWLMFLLGTALLTWILLRRSYRYLGRTKDGSHADRRYGTSSSGCERSGQSLAHAPKDVLRWQVEMHETARDLKAELDSKMGALQQLSRIAEQHCQRLETAILHAEKIGSKPRDSGD